MFEKLLLAVMITFSLNLFLGVRLPSKTQTASSPQLAETTTTVEGLLKKAQAFRTAIKREENVQHFLPSESAPPNVGHCSGPCIID